MHRRLARVARAEAGFEPDALDQALGHLREFYGIEVSPDLIGAVPEAVLDEIAAWQSRPLEPVCSLVFFDAARA